MKDSGIFKRLLRAVLIRRNPGKIMCSLWNRTRHEIPLALLSLLILPGFFNSSLAASPATVYVQPQGKIEGFLSRDNLPDSVGLLAAPPASGSAGYAADEEAYRVARELRGTPRWDQAVEDANITFPEAAGAFSCAIDAPVTEKETPHLYKLLERTKSDAFRAAAKAKKHYRRLRPFIVNEESTCTPADETRFRKSGSYPSAHAATGWVWALILAEIDPDRADAILARGLSFGQSRVICGAHWQSDVVAGQIIGAGVVARLHADPIFRTELAAATAELASARARNLKHARDCTAR
jgi:acid phosphatase (class A)